MMNTCKAYSTATGDFVCDRCGVQWDKDDTPPHCELETPEKASKYVHQVSMERIRVMLS